MQVTIVGTGYVGLCTGVVFAERGHDVTLVDLDEERVGAVNDAQAPFHEPGLPEALAKVREAGTLEATTNTAEAVPRAKAVYLCVGTPRDASGRADLSSIEQAARDVGQALDPADEPVVVTKSTVPPGTTRGLVAPTVLEAAGLADVEDPPVAFAMNPEFLREGSALADARNPDKIVVGTRDPEAARTVRQLHAGLDAPVVEVDETTAEVIKYANNALLATKVSFANEMANLCEEVGADWTDVAEAVGLDERISGQFLRAGAGFGGSCFPKDVSVIEHVAREHGLDPLVLTAVLERNERQPVRVVDVLEEATGGLDGRRIALLGLAFKPGTDDVRQTRALPIYEELIARGADVVVHDPEAQDNFLDLVPDAEVAETAKAALEGAEGAIVQTAWPSYAKLNPATFADAMADPVVVDARRVLDEEAFAEAPEVTYRAIGLGSPDR